MEKKGNFNFRLISSLGNKLKDEEFKVFFFILNTIALNGGNRTKIYRAVLADLCGKSERSISRITDKLADEGYIIKDSVSDGVKRYNYYSIAESSVTQNEAKLGHERQRIERNLVTDDRFNNSNIHSKELKKQTQETKEPKEELSDEEILAQIDRTINSQELEVVTSAVSDESVELPLPF